MLTVLAGARTCHHTGSTAVSVGSLLSAADAIIVLQNSLPRRHCLMMSFCSGSASRVRWPPCESKRFTEVVKKVTSELQLGNASKWQMVEVISVAACFCTSTSRHGKESVNVMLVRR